MSVAIVTNGILLDDMELSRKLVESGVDEVFVSIEGITAASNDFIRGKGTLARVIRGLSNLERCTREGKNWYGFLFKCQLINLIWLKVLICQNSLTFCQ